MMLESVCARSIHRYIAWCDLVSSRGWTFRCKQILSKIKTGNESLVTFKTGDSLSAPWRTLHLSHIQGIFSNWEEWRERVVRFSCGSLTGEVISGSLCDSIAGRRHGIPTIYGTGSHRFVPLVEWGCMEDIILMWVHRSHFISSGIWRRSMLVKVKVEDSKFLTKLSLDFYILKYQKITKIGRIQRISLR